MTAELALPGLAVERAPSSAVARDLACRPSVSLEQVLSVAQLTTRHDQKYLVPLDALPAVLDHLPHRNAVLDIGGCRTFAYESVYFDTESYALYRQHLQGRRKRYKVRIRTYRDTGESMFEVKLRGLRGQTVKERMHHDFLRREELTAECRAFADRVIADAYGVAVPPLRAVLTTAYRRTTLVDLTHRSRLTIDVNLTWSGPETSKQADHLALIETKSLSGPSPADALLRSLGMRPTRISKYCLGVALLHPETTANPWSRLLKSEFGWERALDVRALG
jgi:hypothetical protein